MIDALIAGKLFGAPQKRTGKSGHPFVVAKVRATAGDGESLFVNVIAFDAKAQAALLALVVKVLSLVIESPGTDAGGGRNSFQASMSSPQVTRHNST